jgi:hypothetical protein
LVHLTADESAREVPLVNSAVNAISGAVEAHPTIKAPTHAAYIDAGTIFRACNLVTESQCTFPAPPAKLPVHDGDILLLKAMLHNSGWRPLPYAKFFVTAATYGEQFGLKPSEMSVGLLVAWPLSNSLDDAERPAIDGIVLKLPTPAAGSNLDYVPGSTVLLGLNDRLIARLPDGIMSPAGIALTEIGAPASCFQCNSEYVRFISFKVRVRQAR